MSNRIPTLDGWRGIAILLVLFDHLQLALTGQAPRLPSGQHGVTLFFVLSGYLITTSLLANERIDLKRFYVRRFFRLMPAAWAYLIFLAVVGFVVHMQEITLKEAAASIFFFRNYLVEYRGGANLHFWSLSVEEQFYLVWPAILLWIGARRAKWFLGVTALIVAAFRFAHWDAYNKGPYLFRTEVRADALCVGCLFALVLQNEQGRQFARRWSFLALPAALVFAACMARFPLLPPLIECVAVAVLITATSLNPQSAPSRMLSLRPLAWLGMISYSLYVWQMFFFVHHSKFDLFTICLITFFALASYYFIEQPCIRFGARLMQREKTAPIAFV